MENHIFVTMKELVIKSNENQDWITYIFFFNFLLLAFLNWKFKTQFKRLFYFLKIDFYSVTYFNEQFRYLFRPFNIGCFLILICSLNLWLYFIIESFEGVVFFLFEFYYVFLLMVALFVVRFLIVEWIIQVVSNKNEIKQSLFKSFAYNTLIGMITLIFLLFYHYAQYDTIVLRTFSGLLICVWIITQISVLFGYFKKNIKDLVYIIFYLCTMKIAPWLWFYKLVVETRL